MKTIDIKNRIVSKCCFCEKDFITNYNNGIHEKVCPDCNRKMMKLIFREKNEEDLKVFTHCWECKCFDTESCFCYNRNVTMTGCLYAKGE